MHETRPWPAELVNGKAAFSSASDIISRRRITQALTCHKGWVFKKNLLSLNNESSLLSMICGAGPGTLQIVSPSRPPLPAAFL